MDTMGNIKGIGFDDSSALHNLAECYQDDERDPTECDTEAEYMGLERIGFGAGRVVYRVSNADDWEADFMDYSSVVKIAREKEHPGHFGGRQQNQNEVELFKEIESLNDNLGEIRAYDSEDHMWVVMERMKHSLADDKQAVLGRELHKNIRKHGWKCKEIDEFGDTWDGKTKVSDYGACFRDEDFPFPEYNPID